MAHPSEGSKEAEAKQENTDNNQFTEILKETQIQLRRDPDNQELLLQLATLQKHQGETTKAVENALKVKLSEKSNPTTLLNLGCLLFELGNADDAIARIKLALKRRPDYAHAYSNLGAMLNAKHNRHSAIRSYLKACHLEANNSSHYHTAGCLYRDEQNLESAKSLVKSAILLAPTDASNWFTLGLIQHAEGEAQKKSAIRSYLQCLYHNKKNKDAFNNIGYIYQQEGRLDKAIFYYKKGLSIDSSNAHINHNLSTALLACGNYPEGWKHYHWRLSDAAITAVHAVPECPIWDGSIPTTDERIGIISEQGLGDTLHFIRYCLVLKKMKLSYQVFAQKPLLNLIKEAGIDEQCQSHADINHFKLDKWIPLMSLPWILGVTPSKPIIQTPYLKTRPTLIKKWRTKLKSRKAFTIGIKWQGTPSNENLFGDTTTGRSFPLKALKPITDNFDVSLVSLQKDAGSEQIKSCGFAESFSRANDEIQEIRCFQETAAIMKNCDLIITSDSLIAHLAGGLGLPTWILLSHNPEWRWGIQGSTTFWYPSATLFRQTSKGNWTEVVQSVVKKLEELQIPKIHNPSSSL